MNTTTPQHRASLLLRAGLGRGIAAVLVAAGCLTGCDAPDDGLGDDLDERALEELDDEELDALAAEEDEAETADEVEPDSSVPDAPEVVAEQTLGEVLASLPPEAITFDVSPEDLDRPLEVSATQVAIDVDGNGIIDGMDDLVDVTDPMAIGEMACATNSIVDPTDGAAVAMSATPSCGHAYDGSTSPNTSYDSPGCPHQYITEVTGTWGKPLSFYWDWHGGSLDQTTCELAHANLSAYGAVLTFPFGTSWTKIGTTSVHGKWVSGPLFSYCGWELDAGSAPLPSLGANHIYFKVRTATQATGFVFKQRVEGGVSHGPGPC